MKEVKRYKCDHCKVIRATIKGIERHEGQCLHNPNGVNCFSCEYAYEGDYEDDYGHTIQSVPMCSNNEDIIRENFASKCDMYKRVDKPYYCRKVCTKLF